MYKECSHISDVKGGTLNTVINKSIWMKSFAAGVPTAVVLRRDIHRLHNRLKQFDAGKTRNNKSTRSRIYNSLQRRHKMLAAVTDGQPWAWMLYPSVPI